jgi:4-hydroxy-tetrahydrodipicolinate synthase
VIAGTGANSTAEAIELTRYAKEVGRKTCLSVVPYYNKPSQEGLYRHFRAIADVGLPVLAVQRARTHGRRSANDTLLRLAEMPSVVGLKDATGDLVRHVELDQAPAGGQGVRAVFGQRRHRARVHAARRPRRHLGHRERRAEGDVRDVRGGAARRCRQRRATINRSSWRLHTKLFVEGNPIPSNGRSPRLGMIHPSCGCRSRRSLRKHHDDGPRRHARGRSRLDRGSLA